jgi:hypothetical protein
MQAPGSFLVSKSLTAGNLVTIFLLPNTFPDGVVVGLAIPSPKLLSSHRDERRTWTFVLCRGIDWRYSFLDLVCLVGLAHIVCCEGGASYTRQCSGRADVVFCGGRP